MVEQLTLINLDAASYTLQTRPELTATPKRFVPHLHHEVQDFITRLIRVKTSSSMPKDSTKASTDSGKSRATSKDSSELPMLLKITVVSSSLVKEKI